MHAAIWICLFQFLDTAAQSLALATFFSLDIYTWASTIDLGLWSGGYGLAVLAASYPFGLALDKHWAKAVFVTLLVPLALVALALLIYAEQCEVLPAFWISAILFGLWDSSSQTLLMTKLTWLNNSTEEPEPLELKQQSVDQPANQSEKHSEGAGNVQSSSEASHAKQDGQASQAKQTKWFSRFGIVSLLGQCVGPTLALAVFGAASGDSNSSGNGDSNSTGNNNVDTVVNIGNAALGIVILLSISLVWHLEYPEKQEQSTEKAKQAAAEHKNKSGQVPWTLWCVFGSELLFSLGAGMILAFAPLFFAVEFQASDMQVALIFLGSPVTVMMATYLMAQVSKAACMKDRTNGSNKRLPLVVLICDLLGSACTLSLAFIPSLVVAAVVFCIRAALLNGTTAIQRAFVVSQVPVDQQGRWNGRENVVSFTWTMSAIVGGILIDQLGFRAIFMITGSVYFAASLLWLPVCLAKSV